MEHDAHVEIKYDHNVILLICTQSSSDAMTGSETLENESTVSDDFSALMPHRIAFEREWD